MRCLVDSWKTEPQLIRACAAMSTSSALAAPTAAEDACFSPGSSDLLGLKLAGAHGLQLQLHLQRPCTHAHQHSGLFGLLATSTIGVFIPFFCWMESRQKLFFLLRAAAAGVVLATGTPAGGCVC